VTRLYISPKSNLSVAKCPFMSDNQGTPIHDQLKSVAGESKQRPTELAHPPAEILDELGEDEEDYEDLSVYSSLPNPA
jgi:hypothetical protein